MKKTVLMSAAKKARIALAVMAVCGFTFAGAQSVFAENVTVDYNKNIIGAGNPSYVTGRYNVVLGIVTQANGESNVVIGDSARAEGSGSTAVGASSEAKNGAAAIGHGAQATGEDSIALGTSAKASANGAVALGFNSTADEANTVSVGGIYQEILGYDPATREPIYESRLLTRKIVNVADGTKDTDAATVGQIITNIKKNGNTLEFYTGKGTDGNGTKKWEFDLAAGGSTLTQTDFDNLLNSSTKLDELLGNKANANGDNITTGAGSKWAETLGTGVIANGNKNLVNGETVYNKIGDTSKLTNAGLGNNLSDAVVNVNTKADNALNKATDNEKKIGDTSKLTTAGLGDNLSDAVVKVNDKVGDTSKLTTANLGNNLSDAVVKVNYKTKENAKAIEKVNGRVDELDGRVDTLGGAVSKLDTKVNKVGAGAAALAALHPMEFDSDNKLTFAAGVGSYHGASAAAIGAFYRPSEQVMFSIAGNMGNGENMVNAGVSFALDRPSKTPTTKAALVKTVAAQNEQIAALNETLAEQSNALEAQSREIAELKAMVQQLAAKQNA
ncbi:YadA-like family protein [uncultured Phascolarctobacterium sp.]|uniref:YadA-like family protein n=1 Tax=uncultured Phascolarctobacterium sp. TaxID=512296 RepID=UPI0025FE5341|nr:YadA-like family protein [uncultured Phascolarctobacterium sp.]